MGFNVVTMNLHYFDVDFIINQNTGEEKLKYNVNDDTKLFLGTNYTILREEFRNYQYKKILTKKFQIL
ncbi:glycosyl transferase-like protein [Clostridium cochlearium]|uniref:hypothetical protein n=1 Tax=Clostridium cochlearium TaxID=1494 RepID=UPI000DF0FB9A|nr:hypothetical protein [Clostridium cochlearium]STA92936.1 glycosyl transferase-like protein [Clostridium cochlearium]